MSNLDALNAALADPTPPPRRHSPNCKRQRNKVQTRERVLTAATELFRQDGFEQATIRAIATKTGMSTGAVFANFDDKAALYRAAFGHAPLSPEDGLILRDRLIELIAAVSGDVEPDLLTGAYDDLDRIYPGWRISTAGEEAAPW